MDELGVESELVRGNGGIYEVAVDGDVVARKTRDGFPDSAQVIEAVRDALT